MNIRQIQEYFQWPTGFSSSAPSGPKPLVSPYGPGYSMHPELSRSLMRIIASRALLVAVPFTFTTLMIATGTTAMSEEGGSPSSLFTSQPGVGSYMDQFM